MKKIISLLLLVLLSTANAASYFGKNQAIDDPNCPTWNINRFKKVEKWFTVGVNKAMSYGYTYEVAIKREHVDAVWCALDEVRARGNRICVKHNFDDPTRPFAKYQGKIPLRGNIYLQFKDLEEQLEKYLDFVEERIEANRISHPNVGTVLELLTRYYLQDVAKIYPRELYSVVGGVEYKKSKGSSTIGELDIIVYDNYTCDVVAIGESKASTSKTMKKSLKKAKKQLARFRNFLNSNR